MRRKPPDGVDPSPYRNLVAEDAHALVAVHETPAERACSLIADDHDGALRPAEIVAQVVFNAPGVTHMS